MNLELPTDANPVVLHQGDCLEVLRGLPDGCVNCCVTSPPYYGLRDYGHAGQIGLEPTPAEYVARLVAVFAEARRVLRDDGTCWVNLGDSYSGGGGYDPNAPSNQGRTAFNGAARSKIYEASKRRPRPGYKPKDLLGIPWRVAFALQADGWYLRQDIIWAKPNPMPESVRDRCTKSHEYVFLLSKNARYYFDAEAIAEKGSGQTQGGLRHKHTENGATEFNRTKMGLMDLVGREWSTRNRRSVWTVTPDPYPGAHFAVMPPELVRPCVLAGSPAGGVVLDPFAGSGTTLAVAVEENRRGLGLELNPEYVRLARKRIAQMTPRLFAGADL